MTMLTIIITASIALTLGYVLGGMMANGAKADKS